MNDLRTYILLLVCFPVVAHAQSELAGRWRSSDGSSVYEFRHFEDGHVEARVLTTTRKDDGPGRIVLDHVEPSGKVYKAVIHSLGNDIPREAILTISKKADALDLEIPRTLSPVHITWTRVGDASGAGASGSTLSLNE